MQVCSNFLLIYLSFFQSLNIFCFLFCNFVTEQLCELGFLAAVSSGSSYKAVTTRLHHTHSSLDIRSVLQGRNLTLSREIAKQLYDLHVQYSAGLVSLAFTARGEKSWPWPWPCRPTCCPRVHQC